MQFLPFQLGNSPSVARLKATSKAALSAAPIPDLINNGTMRTASGASFPLGSLIFRGEFWT